MCFQRAVVMRGDSKGEGRADDHDSERSWLVVRSSEIESSRACLARSAWPLVKADDGPSVKGETPEGRQKADVAAGPAAAREMSSERASDSIYIAPDERDRRG